MKIKILIAPSFGIVLPFLLKWGWGKEVFFYICKWLIFLSVCIFLFYGKTICNPLALVPPVVIICKFLGCASPPLSFLQVLAITLLFFIILCRFLCHLFISLVCLLSPNYPHCTMLFFFSMQTPFELGLRKGSCFYICKWLIFLSVCSFLFYGKDNLQSSCSCSSCSNYL